MVKVNVINTLITLVLMYKLMVLPNFRSAIHDGVAKRIFLHDNDNSDKKLENSKVKIIALM